MSSCSLCGESGLLVLNDGSPEPPLVKKKIGNSGKIWYQTHICAKTPKESSKPVSFSMGVWRNLKNGRTRYMGPHKDDTSKSYKYAPSTTAYGDEWVLEEVIETVDLKWTTVWKKDKS